MSPQIGGGKGNSQSEVILIDDVGEPFFAGRARYLADDEAAPKERMGGVDNFNFIAAIWVLEGGAEMWFLLMKSIVTG
jgi:hypothetical protein